MKKQHLKSLQLNKQTITDLQQINMVTGGGKNIEESIICGTIGITCFLLTNRAETCTLYSGKCVSNNNEVSCDCTVG